MKNNTDYKKNVKMTVIVSMIVVVVIGYFQNRYTIGINPFDKRCLPYDMFLIDKLDKNINKGNFISFQTINVPNYPNGQYFIKMLAGVEGDHVVITDTSVRVNEASYGGFNKGYLKKLNITEHDLRKDETIPPSKKFVIGTTDVSFDSRYWGYIDEKQILGRAYAIW